MNAVYATSLVAMALMWIAIIVMVSHEDARCRDGGGTMYHGLCLDPNGRVLP